MKGKRSAGSGICLSKLITGSLSISAHVGASMARNRYVCSQDTPESIIRIEACAPLSSSPLIKLSVSFCSSLLSYLELCSSFFSDNFSSTFSGSFSSTFSSFFSSSADSGFTSIDAMRAKNSSQVGSVGGSPSTFSSSIGLYSFKNYLRENPSSCATFAFLSFRPPGCCNSPLAPPLAYSSSYFTKSSLLSD